MGDRSSRFELHPAMDLAACRGEFDRTGRLQIFPFLEGQGAAELLAHIKEREDWKLAVNARDRVFEIDRQARAALSPAQREQLESKIAASATAGFQYRYERIMVADEEAERRNRGSLLEEFALFMSSQPVMEFLRDITGFTDIVFADAQATCYDRGDFLTAHDDAVEGKNRRAAYVFGLTAGWRAEWGGLLMFHDAKGDIERALLPRMNALNLFAVPSQHSVSLVAPFAGRPRYAITGWLRASRG